MHTSLFAKIVKACCRLADYFTADDQSRPADIAALTA